MIGFKSIGHFSDKFKRRVKLGLYITICVLLYTWTATVWAQSWIESLILYENKSEVLKGVNVIEVEEVYSNGNFIVKGSDRVYTEEDIKGYARVPFDVKPHYQVIEGYFIAPITVSESSNICIKYGLLDVLCYIMLVLVLYDAYKGKKVWKKVLSSVFFGVSVILSQCLLDLMFGVLFGIGEVMDIVVIVKIFIPIIIIAGRYIYLKKKGK